MTEGIGVEHLLAAAIVAAGGTLVIHKADLMSDEIQGKYISLDLNDDNTITMGLVENE